MVQTCEQSMPWALGCAGMDVLQMAACMHACTYDVLPCKVLGSNIALVYNFLDPCACISPKKRSTKSIYIYIFHDQSIWKEVSFLRENALLNQLSISISKQCRHARHVDLLHENMLVLRCRLRVYMYNAFRLRCRSVDHARCIYRTQYVQSYTRILRLYRKLWWHCQIPQTFKFKVCMWRS